MDDFTPLSSMKSAGADDFTPIGKTAEAPQEKKPGFLKNAYDFMGGAPGLGATGASVIAAALAPETGGLSLILPALAAGGTAGTISALQGDKDPLTTGVASGIGDLGGGVLGKGLGWAGGKLASKFELGKYVGNIGKKLGEVFDMPAMKTTQDIYNALHLGEAEKMLSDAYQGAQNAIFGKVPPDTALEGPVGKRLNILFSNHLPEVKELLELKAQAKGQVGFKMAGKDMPPLRPSMMTQEEISHRIGGPKANPLDESLTLGDAIEYARLLGDKASRSKKGAGGFGLREANRQARRDIATALDQIAPGQELGALYDTMNLKYAQGRTVLSAFEPSKVFRAGKGANSGVAMDRVEWQKQSNDALRRLRDIGLEEIDSIVRLGREPGAVGSTYNLRGTPHGFSKVGGLRALMPPIEIENPLRPMSEIQRRRLLTKALQATGANVGAQGAEY